MIKVDRIDRHEIGRCRNTNEQRGNPQPRPNGRRAHGRERFGTRSAIVVLRSLADFQPLQAAEAKVVAGLGSGDSTETRQRLVPEGNNPARTVRAGLLRLLILGGGGDLRLQEKGLRLSGAMVTGILDLEGCRIPRDIALIDCRFAASPVLHSAISIICLDGSALPGLQADRLEARGGLSINGATVTGNIRLRGVRIGGNIEADGATIAVPGGIAVDAEGLEARGGILLRGANVRRHQPFGRAHWWQCQRGQHPDRAARRSCPER